MSCLNFRENTKRMSLGLVRLRNTVRPEMPQLVFGANIQNPCPLNLITAAFKRSSELAG
jgi:hypothetical protein